MYTRGLETLISQKILRKYEINDPQTENYKFQAVQAVIETWKYCCQEKGKFIFINKFRNAQNITIYLDQVYHFQTTLRPCTFE